MADHLGHRHQQRVVNEQRVLIGEVGPKGRGQQLRPQAAFHLDGRQVAALPIEGPQLRNVEVVRRAGCPEFALNLTETRLDLLAGGEHGFKPKQHLVDVGVRRFDLERGYLLKPLMVVAIEEPFGAVGQHTDVPLAGPLAASCEILGELLLRALDNPAYTKIVSDLEHRGTDCEIDPALILTRSLESGAEVVLVKPKATDQKQFSDVGLDHGFGPRSGAVRETPNKREYIAIHRLNGPDRSATGPWW